MAAANHRVTIACATIAVLVLVGFAWRSLHQGTAPVVPSDTGIESDGVGDPTPAREDDGRENPQHPAQVASSPPETPEPEEETKAAERALSGIVTDRKGWPIEKVGIYARPKDESPAAITDSRGRFEIADLPSSTKKQKLYVRHSDYIHETVPIGTAVETGETLSITLRKGATLRGVVTYGGRPVANQEVKMNRTGWFGSSKAGNTRTEGSGAYEFTTLEPEQIVVHAYLKTGDDESKPRRMRVDVLIEDEQTTVVNFDFPEWDATLEGQVLFNGYPVQNTSMSVVSRSVSGAAESFQGKTDSEGFYRFEALPSGVLEVAVEVEVGATEHARRTTLEIPAGYVTTRDFSFGGTGVVAGYGTGLDRYDHSAILLLAPKFSSLLTEMGIHQLFDRPDIETLFVAGTELAKDGSFRLEGLEAGSYTLLALVNASLSGHVNYTYMSVTVSDSHETHIVLGPEYLTEYGPEEDPF